MPRVLLITFLLLATAPAFSLAQGVDYARANYTKREYQIPMRDGVKLFTAVYSPRDTSKAYPILMTRTQSGVLPYGEDQFPPQLGPSSHLTKAGYIFVYQDLRGRWASEGQFVVLRPHNPRKESSQDTDESSDAYDTIDWLLRNVANHNGRVGYWGSSYRGWLAGCAMIDAHPALKAVSPQAPIGDTFAGDDWHHNGALMLNHSFFYMPFKNTVRPSGPFKTPWPRPDYGTQDGYDFYLRLGPLPNVNARYFHGKNTYWNEILAHPTYDDYWKSIRLIPHLKHIKPAVLIVGGWFDAEDLFGTLLAYHQIEQASPGATSTLVMGPWIHGGWNTGDGSRLGPVAFGSPTSEYYRAEIEFPFFEFHLKGQGKFQPAEALMFETGANQWREHVLWPPRSTRPYQLYFHSRGRLSHEPPAAGDKNAFDEYVSDPDKPVPYVDKQSFRMLAEFMAADQRFAACRPDVLVYETAALDDDVTFVGPLVADLHVSTTGADSDWIVKLIDVYPADTPNPDPNPIGLQLGNYQQLVRGEVMRGKFRQSLEKPEPMTPGEPTAIKFTLPDVYHTFRRGHKIMVQVQSTWFPLVDRNPQKFVNIYEAQESDFQKATQRVYRSPALPSRLVVERLVTSP